MRPRKKFRSILSSPVQGEWQDAKRSIRVIRAASGREPKARRLTTPLRVVQGSPLGGTAATRKWSESRTKKSALEAYTPIRAFSPGAGRHDTKGKHTRCLSKAKVPRIRSALRGVVSRRRRLTPRGGISLSGGVQPTRNERGWSGERNP